MFKLRLGYLLTGIVTGLALLFSFLTTIPDGKLHLVFCDVGQGDAAYIRFPDGRDMLVDGGPNDKVIGCLGRHMPFWDRKINIVILTHPEKDHLQGLISVLQRYGVDYFVRSSVENSTEGYQKLQNVVQNRRIPEKFVAMGEQIEVDQTKLSVARPSSGVLGATTGSTNINEASVVFWLSYGSFDALFTGDASFLQGLTWKPDKAIEVLKVPHHGSKTGMTEEFLNWLRPNLAVISVGKNNSYGHPTKEILEMLAARGVQVLRTDEAGDIEIVADKNGWKTFPLAF